MPSTDQPCCSVLLVGGSCPPCGLVSLSPRVWRGEVSFRPFSSSSLRSPLAMLERKSLSRPDQPSETPVGHSSFATTRGRYRLACERRKPPELLGCSSPLGGLTRPRRA